MASTDTTNTNTNDTTTATDSAAAPTTDTAATPDSTATATNTSAPATDATATTTSAPVAPATAPAATPAAAPAKAVVGGNNFDIRSILPQLSPVGQIVVNNVLAYIDAMGPNQPMTVEQGTRNQVALYRSLTMLINKIEGDEFDLIWGAILKTFEQKSKGVFHEMYLFRFMENIQLPETDRKAFLRLLNLIKLVAPIKGREIALKQVNFAETLAHGIAEAGRQRILNFFGK